MTGPCVEREMIGSCIGTNPKCAWAIVDAWYPPILLRYWTNPGIARCIHRTVITNAIEVKHAIGWIAVADSRRGDFSRLSCSMVWIKTLGPL